MQLLRDPNFALSPETLLKIWQGLVHAVRWHLTDCSARYASNFHEGIFAISLVRSLAAAGEVLADYLRHVSQVVKAFTGSEPIVDRSSGIVAPDPSAAPAAQPETAPDPGTTIDDQRSTNHERRSNHGDHPSLIVTLATGLAQVSWRRLRASRAHAAWERRSVERLFRQIAGERERGRPITAQRLIWLGEDLDKVLVWSAERFARQVRRLNRRFEALAARLLDELGLPPMPLHTRPSPAVASATADSLAEALGNPGRNPARVRVACEPRQPRVKSTPNWQHSHGVWRPGVRRRRTREERGLVGARVDQFENFIPNVLRAAFQSDADQPEPGQPGSKRSEAAPPSGGDRQAFFDVVARGVGPHPSLQPGETDGVPGGLAEALWNRLEFTRQQAEDERTVFRALLEDYCSSLCSAKLASSAPASSKLASSEFEVPSSELIESSESENAEPRTQNAELFDPELEPLKREIAELEDAELADEQSSIDSLQSSSCDDRQSAIPDRLTELATALVLLLRADDDDFRLRAEVVKFRARVWIYLMLITRNVPRHEIVLLRPMPLSDCGMFARTLKLAHSRDPQKRAEADRLSVKSDVVLEEWWRWQPVLESGDIGRLLPEMHHGAWRLEFGEMESAMREASH